jgi:hypothetical protein
MTLNIVMAGLVPATYVLLYACKRETREKDVDARHKAGHDDGEAVRFT